MLSLPGVKHLLIAKALREKLVDLTFVLADLP